MFKAICVVLVCCSVFPCKASRNDHLIEVDGTHSVSRKAVRLHYNSSADARGTITGGDCPASDTDDNDEGYTGVGKRLFWSKHSCMTVAYCFAHHAFQIRAGSTMHGSSVWQGRSGHKFCQNQSYGGFCGKNMQHFMDPMRAELSKCGWDLYGDFADTTLIAENSKEWVDGARNPNEEEAITAHNAQLCRLRNRVMKTSRFVNFPVHHEGEYCKAESDAAHGLVKDDGHDIHWQVIKFKDYGERMQFLQSALRYDYPKDRFDPDIEAKIGADMGVWLCEKLVQ